MSQMNSLALPGSQECPVCLENVSSVKLVPCCGYQFCSTCESSFRSMRPGFRKCPQCRVSLPCGALQTRYFGRLKCDYCLELKDVGDFWFCSTCLKSFCSRCQLKEHMSKNPTHQAEEWKTENVRLECENLLNFLAQYETSQVRAHNKREIGEFLAKLKDDLEFKLEESAKTSRNNTRAALSRAFGPMPPCAMPTTLPFAHNFDATLPWSNLLRKVLQLCGSDDSHAKALENIQIGAKADEFAARVLSTSMEALALNAVNPQTLIAGPQVKTVNQLQNEVDRLEQQLSDARDEAAELRQAAESQQQQQSQSNLKSWYSVCKLRRLCVVPKLLFTQSNCLIYLTPEVLKLVNIEEKSGNHLRGSWSMVLVDCINPQSSCYDDKEFVAAAYCSDKGNMYTLSRGVEYDRHSEEYSGYSIDCYQRGDDELRFGHNCVAFSDKIDGCAAIAVTSTDAVYYTLTKSTPRDYTQIR